MSLNIRYITNGEISEFVVFNKGVRPCVVEFHTTREDIDERIRHYAPKGEPKLIGPDGVRIIGNFEGCGGKLLLDHFYPNHPYCGMDGYQHKLCIAESCGYAPDGDWTKCGHFHKDLEIDVKCN